MPMNFPEKSHALVSNHSFFLNPIGKITVTFHQHVDFSSQPVLSHSSSSPLHLRQTQLLNPIFCARKKRNGSGFRKLTKILPKLVYIAAFNLKVLPEPLNLILEEFGGGSGGGRGLGFWKAFGDGNFDGWRRKKKKNVDLLGILVICGLGLLLFGREQLKNESFCNILALGLIAIFLFKDYKKSVKDWVLGFCFIGALMGFRLSRKEMQQWIQRFGFCLPALELVERKKRNGGRVF